MIRRFASFDGGGRVSGGDRVTRNSMPRRTAVDVIQCPVSTVMELIENSLDADSNSISVAVKDGGLKLIQFSDQGLDIRLQPSRNSVSEEFKYTAARTTEVAKKGGKFIAKSYVEKGIT